MICVYYLLIYFAKNFILWLLGKGKKFLFFLIFLFCLLVLGTVAWSLHKLKNFNKIHFHSNTHYIYDRNGTLIGYTSPKISVFTELNDFPLILRQTIIAVEDRGFENHIGISISGILRSIIFYFPSMLTGYRPRGGSTITQQLMRQLYLNDSLSFFRKYKEVVLSMVASAKISKHDILEVYMNHAYFCNNIYGFRAATDVFFGKKLEDLGPEEVAILVSMLKGPEYSPVKNLEKLITRRNIILKIMLKDKIITKDEYDVAIKKPIDVSVDRFNHVNFTSLEVKNYIIENFGENVYNSGGLKIYTSIDMEKQKIAEEALQEACLMLERDCEWTGPVGKIDDISNTNGLWKYLEQCGRFYIPVIIINESGSFLGHKLNGKLRSEDIKKYEKFKKIEKGDVVIIDKKNHFLVNYPSFNGQVTILKNGYNAGDVLASVGGIDLFLLRDDITKLPREVGSCMKILDILIAFEVLKCPTNTKYVDNYAVVNNNKLVYVTEEDFKKHYSDYYDRDDKKIWPVVNWDHKYWQELTLRSSFENSRNIPLLALILNDVGCGNFKKYLDLLKITTPKDDFYPSYVLGSISISPRKFAEVVCGIMNYGNKLQSTFVKEICDESDNIVYKNTKKDVKRIFSDQSIYALLSCMKGCATRGNGSRLNGVMNNIYAKPGTSSNNRDACCICVTKDLVIYVVICKNSGKSMGNSVWGAAYPVICVKRIIERLKPGLLDIAFMDMPEGVYTAISNYNLFKSPQILSNFESIEVFFNPKI